MFAIWVRREGKLQRNGTATLIDDSGIFLTADHVVHWDTKHPVRITQKLAGEDRSYDAEVLWSSENYRDQDLALLRALNWEKEARYPYPLRFDDIDKNDGAFIGFEEQSEGPIYKSVPYYKTDASGERNYQGMIVSQSSGALLFDEAGRAFAIVVMHAVPQHDSLIDLPPEQLFKDWLERATISAFPLQKALPQAISSSQPTYAGYHQILASACRIEAHSSRHGSEQPDRFSPSD